MTVSRKSVSYAVYGSCTPVLNEVFAYMDILIVRLLLSISLRRQVYLLWLTIVDVYWTQVPGPKGLRRLLIGNILISKIIENIKLFVLRSLYGIIQ